MDNEFRDLYQEIILEHNRSPRNFGTLDDATHVLEGVNPLCGDRYKIYLKIDNDRITDIRFEGSGCAISKASASVMSTAVKGKTTTEADDLFELFQKIVKGEEKVDELLEKVGKLAAFAGVSEFPMRVKCATLAWHTLHNALHGNKEAISTE